MTQPIRFAILDYPGAMQSAVLGLQDVLSFAGDGSGRTLQIDVLERFSGKSDAYDAVILPPSAGAVRVEEVPDLPPFLKARHASGSVVCSACTGLNFVMAAGLAGRRKVTTHWALEQRLRAAYPQIDLDTDRLLIEYTDLITAGGLMAWVDLALALIERFLGYGTAVATARHFIVDFRRRDQRRFRRFLPDLRHGDTAVLKAQHFLEGNLEEAISIPAAAEEAGLPQRTFLRRFRAATGISPKTYLQELRIERARDLLIETEKSVSEICYAVGYNDPPSFVRLFTRLSGLPPGSFREHYRRDAQHAD
ncbi:GlxA family transcriptional regulator [Roseibium sp.]|uniref:GlxA family transcriptional regulator n=1 Tax=Roseibium sp. TaxID=1936156 RepID=UPI003D0D75BB